jgi:hypothetical protein
MWAAFAARQDSRAETRSTRSNSAAFDGDGCGVPTSWRTVAAGDVHRERGRVERVADDARAALREPEP